MPAILRSPDWSRWEALLTDVELPEFTRVKQSFPKDKLENVSAAVAAELGKSEVARHLKPDARVAVGVGSRGLASLLELVQTTIQVLKDRGCEPFIVPAMGSHGGATAEGQRQLLAGYGISEEALGAPVETSMDTVTLGKLKNGLPIYFSKTALAADLILPINRVKSHTSFRGAFESGLTKMLVIGFAKHVGAQSVHALGYEQFFENVKQARDVLLEQVPFAFGLSTVENAYGQVMHVEAVGKDDLGPREQSLLKLSKAQMAKLYLNDLDVLIVEEIGKNISGLGMDPNVTGRFASKIEGELRATRVVVLGLSDKTQGNAIGLGLADITTLEAVQDLNPDAGWLNAVTSTSLSAAKIPIFMRDRDMALKLAFKTCGQPDMGKVRAVVIKNSSSLDEIQVSEALLSEVEASPQLSATGEPQALHL